MIVLSGNLVEPSQGRPLPNATIIARLKFFDVVSSTPVQVDTGNPQPLEVIVTSNIDGIFLPSQGVFALQANDLIYPSGSAWEFTLRTPDSSPSQTFTPVVLLANMTSDRVAFGGFVFNPGTPGLNLGEFISQKMKPLVVKSSNMSAAYYPDMVINAKDGDCYADLTQGVIFSWNGATWVPFGGSKSKPVLSRRTIMFGSGEQSYAPTDILSPFGLATLTQVGIPGGNGIGWPNAFGDFVANSMILYKASGTITTGATAPKMVANVLIGNNATGAPWNLTLPANANGTNTLYWEASVRFTPGNGTLNVSGKLVVTNFAEGNTTPDSVFTWLNSFPNYGGLNDHTHPATAVLVAVAFDGPGNTVSIVDELLELVTNQDVSELFGSN